MRTRFEIVLADDRDPASLRAAGEEALAEIARVEQELSAFRPDSFLARVNAEAAEHPVLVDGVTFAFLARAGELAAAVDGAFDPTVGALTALLRRGASEAELAEAPVGFAKYVRLDAEARTVAFTTRGVRLDPGAIGKGWALDRAVEVLREAGVKHALLHGGTSSVVAMGEWPVAVQHPTDPDRRLARVKLRDQALGVSAIHGRAFRRGEERVGHVVDPRTGASVAHTLQAAVITDSATEADALSTAMLVLGRPIAGTDALIVSADGKRQATGLFRSRRPRAPGQDA